MSHGVETSVAQVGLRDLLFYVLPGTVLSIGLAGLLGIRPGALKEYSGLAPSVAAVLLAYLLGQCAYPAAYVVRKIMEPTQSIKKGTAEFRSAYSSASDGASTFFAVEIFRYRTLARFCSVMVGPILFAVIAALWGGWSLPEPARLGVAVAGLLTVSGFLYRQHRYEERYRKAVVEIAGKLKGKMPGAKTTRHQGSPAC